MLGKKTGGRKKGTPNKENPLKGFLKAHSYAYFDKTIPVTGELLEAIGAAGAGLAEGDLISQFDIDTAAMPPDKRVDAEIKILAFHLPKMQQTAVDLAVVPEASESIAERLERLAAEEAAS